VDDSGVIQTWYQEGLQYWRRFAMDEISVTAEHSEISSHHNSRHDAPLRYKNPRKPFPTPIIDNSNLIGSIISWCAQDIPGRPWSHFLSSGPHLHWWIISMWVHTHTVRLVSSSLSIIRSISGSTRWFVCRSGSFHYPVCTCVPDLSSSSSTLAVMEK
jgi:hypothetical protein